MPSDSDVFEDDAPPFDTPDDLRPRAFEAFEALIRDCGKTVHRMPASCEMYLRQYLDRYGRERDLLIAVLRQGLPDQILLHAKRDGYDEFLASTAGGMAQSAGVPVPHAKWAVEAWATVLGRPPGYQAGPVVARPVAPPPGYAEATAPPVSDRGLRYIMATIAAAGGFTGGALGNGGLMLFMLASGMAVDAHFGQNRPGANEFALAIVIAILMLVGGVAGGLGAFAGWLFGRGDARPWAGFSAACGAAFATACLLFFCIGPGLITAVAQCVSAFGAAFTAASRGGNRI